MGPIFNVLRHSAEPGSKQLGSLLVFVCSHRPFPSEGCHPYWIESPPRQASTAAVFPSPSRSPNASLGRETEQNLKPFETAQWQPEQPILWPSAKASYQ